jgi:hypothetical protein
VLTVDIISFIKNNNHYFFSRFKEFPKLAKLVVSKGLLQDIFEAQDLMDYFPHVVEIKVHVPYISKQEKYKKSGTEHKKTGSDALTKVQKVQLIRYELSEDEILFGVNKIYKSETLDITTSHNTNDSNWDPPIIDLSTAKVFLQYITTNISTYQVQLSNLLIGDVKTIMYSTFCAASHPHRLVTCFQKKYHSKATQPNLVAMIASKDQLGI